MPYVKNPQPTNSMCNSEKLRAFPPRPGTDKDVYSLHFYST